jgi:hypothetical protein
VVHVPSSAACGTSEHDIFRIIDCARLGDGDKIAPTVLFSLDLLLSRGQTPSQGLRARSDLIASCTTAEMRGGWVFFSSNAYASSALENEEVISSLRNKMVSTSTIAEASFVVRTGAALAKYQRTLDFVVACMIAGGAFLLMSFSKGVVRWEFVEDLLGGDNPRTKVFLGL